MVPFTKLTGIILVFFMVGCDSLSPVTSEPPKDPAGTVSLSVRYDQQPFVYIDQAGKIFTQANDCSGTCPNWSFKLLSTLDMQCNSSQSGMSAPMISDLGHVEGLGAIKDNIKPALAQAQAINGHGYLLKGLFGQSVAVYVESDVVGINGGVYGKNIKLAVIGNAGKGTETAPSAIAKEDGTQICPLGWSAGLSASAMGSKITVSAKCGETDYFTLDFSPTPAAGGSAPLVDGQISGANAYASCTSSAPSTMAGAVTVSGTTGSLTVNGSVRCTYSYSGAVTHEGTVQFANVPLTVQP